MSRSRGTYSTLENWALDLAPTLPGAAGWVLLKLAAQVNYKRKTMTIGQLIDALPYKERTLQQACAFLVQEGYALCAGNEYILRGSCTELAQGLRKNAHPEQDKKADADAERPSKNSGITEHNQKESEGREEKELKDKNTPLTPQGVMPEGSGQESAGQQGEAGDRPPHQDSSKAPQQPSPATDLEEVPRRAAAPALPDDLAALPGMPEAWERWRKHAREIRLQLKESTAQAQFAKLRALHAEGRDLPQHVDHAIEVGWRSFYPIKGGPPGRQQQPAPQTEPKPRTREEWLS